MFSPGLDFGMKPTWFVFKVTFHYAFGMGATNSYSPKSQNKLRPTIIFKQLVHWKLRITYLMTAKDAPTLPKSLFYPNLTFNHPGLDVASAIFNFWSNGRQNWKITNASNHSKYQSSQHLFRLSVDVMNFDASSIHPFHYFWIISFCHFFMFCGLFLKCSINFLRSVLKRFPNKFPVHTHATILKNTFQIV